MKADGKKIIIIGGGASGLMAAIAAGRCGASVTVLEAMKKPGRKLLLTGNGRCNLTNLDPELASRYRSAADGGFCAASRAEPVIRQFIPEPDPDILHTVMVIYPRVALAPDGQVKPAMHGKERQHMIKKPDAG